MESIRRTGSSLVHEENAWLHNRKFRLYIISVEARRPVNENIYRFDSLYVGERERERKRERVSSSLIRPSQPLILDPSLPTPYCPTRCPSVVFVNLLFSQSFRRLSTPCRCLDRSMSTAGQEMRRWRISKESVDAAIIIYIQFYRHCGTLRRSQSLFREMSRRHHRRCRLCFLPKQSFPVDGILIQCLPVGVDAQRLEVADDVKRTTRTC